MDQDPFQGEIIIYSENNTSPGPILITRDTNHPLVKTIKFDSNEGSIFFSKKEKNSNIVKN